MAASSAQGTNGPCKIPAFALLLIVPLLHAGVMAQGGPQDGIRGDNILKKTEAPVTANPTGQVLNFPTPGPLGSTEQTTKAEKPQDHSPTPPLSPAEPDQKVTVKVHTDKPVGNPETPAPIPPRGDGPDKPKPVPREDVVCKSKEAMEGKNAVHVKLKSSSNCRDTQMKITSVLQELCGEDCKLELYQEDNTDELLVSGKYVEDDVLGMTKKFNNDNIKDKTNVVKANPRWRKNSKLVLVSVLLAGLLLAALLVAGYYFKTHRKNSKGVRLAESFQVDEENQANTLVSVAPLPQEPLDKPTINGESPPENGTNPTPTTNGHSANQTQVADTEM